MFLPIQNVIQRQNRAVKFQLWEVPARPDIATVYRTKRRPVIRNGPATYAAEINDRRVRQPKSQAPSYRSGRRLRDRRDIRGQACQASARGQGRLPDALTQIAARPAMELRAGERNS